MTAYSSPGPINAVLSVADAAPGQDHIVQLSIRGEGIPGDRTATAALDRQQAEDLGNDAAAIGACLGRGTPSPDRIQAGERLFEAVFTRH